jgi:hypothetical protein
MLIPCGGDGGGACMTLARRSLPPLHPPPLILPDTPHSFHNPSAVDELLIETILAPGERARGDWQLGWWQQLLLVGSVGWSHLVLSPITPRSSHRSSGSQSTHRIQPRARSPSNGREVFREPRRAGPDLWLAEGGPFITGAAPAPLAPSIPSDGCLALLGRLSNHHPNQPPHHHQTKPNPNPNSSSPSPTLPASSSAAKASSSLLRHSTSSLTTPRSSASSRGMTHSRAATPTQKRWRRSGSRCTQMRRGTSYDADYINRGRLPYCGYVHM